MHSMTLTQLVPILQLSVSPVILISGMGLLLLTLTNRFGRMVDRARLLSQELARNPAEEKARETRIQIGILMRRASILRLAIILGSVTALLAGFLVLLLFLGAFFQQESVTLVVAVFCAAILCLIGSIGAFILDTNLALAAVRHEVKL